MPEPTNQHGLDDAYAVETPEDNRRLYRSWATTYDSDFIAGHGYIYHEKVVEVFADAATAADGPVLDVGCGTGVVALALAHHHPSAAAGDSWIVDGLDISAEMLAEAKHKTIAPDQPAYRSLLEADLTKRLPIDDGAYGAVVSSGTFTHGHVGPEAIDELVRVIRPGGVACLGINAEHFGAKQFDRRLEQLVAHDQIAALSLTRVPMYNVAPDAHEHATDAAMVAVFRVV